MKLVESTHREKSEFYRFQSGCVLSLVAKLRRLVAAHNARPNLPLQAVDRTLKHRIIQQYVHTTAKEGDIERCGRQSGSADDPSRF